MLYTLSLLVVLYLFWLLLSGYFTLFLLAAGAGSAVAVVWFARRLEVIDAEGHPVELGPRASAYTFWLFGQIIKSGWEVSRIIVHPRLPISPTLVRFRPSQKTAVGLTTHANSITLTPGTISVDVGPDEFLVHALTRAGAQGVVGSEMDRRIAAFEVRR